MLSPITSAAPFSVTGAPSWLTFHPIQPADTQIVFEFSPNASINSRSATIKVGGRAVTVTQAGLAGAPVLSVPPSIPNAAVSASYDLAVPTMNGPVTYTATGLPAGMTLSNLTGHITGYPSTAKTYAVTISARNARGTSGAAIAFNINVLPFPDSLVGSYSATVDADPAINAGLGGFLTFAVSANGAVSGTLKSGSASPAFTGRLNTGVNPSNPVPLAAQLTVGIPKTSLILNVLMNSRASGSPAGYVTGSVSLGSSSAALAGEQQVWSLSGHAPATGYLGSYTAALQPAGADAAIPQGDGFLIMAVSTKGVISWSGQLADGTVLAAGTTNLGPEGEVPLFAALNAGKGSLLGSPQITTGSPQALGGSLGWTKHASAAGVRAYQQGFGAFNPASLTVVGGAYTPPAKTVAVMPAGQITFADGGIEQAAMYGSLTQEVAINSSNVATLPAVAAGNLANVRITKITPATGAFTGSFTLKDNNPFNGALPQVSRTANFNGVFLQGALNQGTGYFLLPTIAGPPANVTTSPLTSGQVSLMPN